MDIQHIVLLEAGKDYPHNWNEFLDWVRPDRDRLKGSVEVDETYLAITDREEPLSSMGRKSKTSKVLVVLAVDIQCLWLNWS